MKLQLSTLSSVGDKNHIRVTGSKSESNRLLLLQALYPTITIANLSNSDDAQVMQQGLALKEGTIDIHHAGTAMRFLTAYFASHDGKEVVLTGSRRMKERPIGILVDALRYLGADIKYENIEGYPPLRIKGKTLNQKQVSLPANVSSQYISALLLIAPHLEDGLELHLIGTITSMPYIKMTLDLLNQIGVQHSFKENIIKVLPKALVSAIHVVVESDWSSASYFYSIVALSGVGTSITLSSYKNNSLQGDSVLSEIYKDFGVKTELQGHQLTLTKCTLTTPESISIDLSNAPDLAQTIAVSCFGLGLACYLTGLHTLKIKETDRLEALKTELSKFGATIMVTDDTLDLAISKSIMQDVVVDTYNDHRMAMAFAPLAVKCPLIINDAEVVSKSYPDFWKDLRKLKFGIKEM